MLTNITRYGAIFAKIRAMYGSRLREDDFQKITTLESVVEVAAFLRSHSLWGRALRASDSTTLRRSHLEYTLRQHFLGEYLRLLPYLSRDDQKAVRFPVLNAEIEQIMRYMRLAGAGRVAEYAYDLPPYFNKHSHIHYEQLSQAETYEGMLSAVRQTDFFHALEKLTPADGSFPDYLDVELAMRTYLFNSMIRQSEHYGGREAELFRQWIHLQSDWYNIIILMRVISGYPHMRDTVAKYLIPLRGHISTAEVSALTSAKDVPEFLAVLRNTYYGRQEETKGGLTMATLEATAKRQQLRFCRRHICSEPSAFTVICYTQLLRGEMDNLICAIECVRYRLPPSKAMERIILE